MRASDLRDSIIEAVGDRMSASELSAILPELFMETQLVLVEDRWAGQPFVLAPMIRDNFIRPLFGTLQADNTRLYTEGIIGMPRKWSKTTTIAATALTCLVMEPVDAQLIGTVAYDLGQAQKSLQIGKWMIERNPRLKKLCKPYSDRIYIPDNGSMWRVFPHDSDDVQGEGIRVGIFEEPHTYKKGNVINGVRSGMGAREEPLLLGVTTAGAKRSGVLWDWIHGEVDPETNQREGGIIRDPRGLYYWYGATDEEDIKDREIWRKYNAPWITMEYLEDQFRRMPRREFERYHLNRWPRTGVYSAAIPAGVWMSDANRRKPVFNPDLPSVMAVDAADKRDRTAFTTIQVDASGDYNVWCDVRFNDQEREYADYLSLEADLRTNAVEYNVERIGFDRRQMARTMAELEDEGYPVEEVNQGNELMCSAAQFLFDLAATGKLRHGGDPVLAAHIASAAAYERPPYGWRFAKADRNDPECKIDAAISTAMAAWMAQATPPKVDFSSGGLHSVRL